MMEGQALMSGTARMSDVRMSSEREQSTSTTDLESQVEKGSSILKVLLTSLAICFLLMTEKSFKNTGTMAAKLSRYGKIMSR